MAEHSKSTTRRRFHWRRLIQFRLRTLLVLTTIIAVWFGWWSYKARQQREVVARLTEAGVEVFYDFEEPLGRGLEGPPYVPEWLVNRLGVDYFATVIGVNFSHTHHATDQELPQLNDFRAIRILWIGDSHVTDTGLTSIREMTTLENLALYDTQVTDAGLEHIKGLIALKILYLDGTKVTDAGVERLQKALPQCWISRNTLSPRH